MIIKVGLDKSGTLENIGKVLGVLTYFLGDYATFVFKDNVLEVTPDERVFPMNGPEQNHVIHEVQTRLLAGSWLVTSFAVSGSQGGDYSLIR